MRALLLASALLAFGCGDDGTGYDPCADLGCGNECQICDPDDDQCVEPGVVSRCDVAGVCSSSPVTCPGEAPD